MESERYTPPQKGKIGWDPTWSPAKPGEEPENPWKTTSQAAKIEPGFVKPRDARHPGHELDVIHVEEDDIIDEKPAQA